MHFLPTPSLHAALELASASAFKPKMWSSKAPFKATLVASIYADMSKFGVPEEREAALKEAKKRFTVPLDELKKKVQWSFSHSGHFRLFVQRGLLWFSVA